jgi:hypothetical protein
MFLRSHTDVSPSLVNNFCPIPEFSNRVATVIVYLNDVAEGGATRFTDLGAYDELGHIVNEKDRFAR